MISGSKLPVDFTGTPWLCAGMEVDDLIDQLCVMAGMIMEDASVGAVSNSADRKARVTALVRASETIASLAKAASAMMDER